MNNMKRWGGKDKDKDKMSKTPFDSEIQAAVENAATNRRGNEVLSRLNGDAIDMATSGALVDKAQFFDRFRGNFAAKLGITDEHAHDVHSSPVVQEVMASDHNWLEGIPAGPVLTSPFWGQGLRGYVKDGLRNLGISLTEEGMPILSKTKGAELAHATHTEAINYYLRQIAAKDQIIEEYLHRDDLMFTFNWDDDTTPQNCHRKMAKEMAKAQVLWLEPWVAQLIDAGADQLFDNGMKTGQWPTISPDEMRVFDHNMFIVSVGTDKDSGATWPTIHWFCRGVGHRSVSKDTWQNQPAHHIAQMTAGWDQTTAPILNSHPMLVMGFDDWGRFDTSTYWNFDEEIFLAATAQVMTVPDLPRRGDHSWKAREDGSLDADGDESLMPAWYWDKRQELIQLWNDKIEKMSPKEKAVFTRAPYELTSMPSWAIAPDNARVRCGVRALLDYVNRKNMNELTEVSIPYRRLKITKRNAGKFGFDPKAWKPTIKIIDLPRKPYRPKVDTVSNRRLTCQHLVEQHIRQQYYPSLGIARDEDGDFNPESHKAILIPTHIKGPEDRPFKEYNQVVYAILAATEAEE
jgi:hypothetical protein